MRVMLYVVVVSSLFSFLLVAQEPPAAPEPSVQDQLKTLIQKVDELNKRMEKLEKSLENSPFFPGARADGRRQNAKGFPRGNSVTRSGEGNRAADPDVLDKIQLPPQPTREQVVEYVTKIIRASEQQDAWGSDDPQVAMLKSIGAEYLDVLLPHYSGPVSFYVQNAVTGMVRQEHGALVIPKLAKHPNLIAFVERFGWEKEAKTQLIEGLKTGPKNLPGQWVQMVAALNDPETYELLLNYMTRCDDPYVVYDAIKGLPGIELDDAVGRAWKNLVSGGGQRGPWGMRSFADIAVSHGHLDALEMVIDKIDEEHFFMGPRFSFDRSLTPRRVVLKHIEFHGTNKEIKEWYEKNMKQLRFDKKRRVFIVVPSAA